MTTPTYVVHTGSYSLDRHDLTKAQIDAQIQAIVTAIPNAGYIAIGTYLDYPDQIKLWVNSIHKHGKKAVLRSAGYLSWQGRNGFPPVGTPTQYENDLPTFIGQTRTVWRSGDIFEPVPDEPEGGTYWDNKYGVGGVGDSAESVVEYNAFIQASKDVADRYLAAVGATGVKTNYVWTYPSTSHDVLTVAGMVHGTDDYPESTTTDPTVAATAMRDELSTWCADTYQHHITFGPSVYVQLTETQQANMYTSEGAVVKLTPNIEGITVWQGGANDNPFSRLFDYSGGVWTARSAATAVNNLFI